MKDLHLLIARITALWGGGGAGKEMVTLALRGEACTVGLEGFHESVCGLLLEKGTLG